MKICRTLSGTDTSLGIHFFIASFIVKAKGKQMKRADGKFQRNKMKLLFIHWRFSLQFALEDEMCVCLKKKKFIQIL